MTYTEFNSGRRQERSLQDAFARFATVQRLHNARTIKRLDGVSKLWALPLLGVFAFHTFTHGWTHALYGVLGIFGIITVFEIAYQALLAYENMLLVVIERRLRAQDPIHDYGGGRGVLYDLLRAYLRLLRSIIGRSE
jgi:hypothetical protein